MAIKKITFFGMFLFFGAWLAHAEALPPPKVPKAKTAKHPECPKDYAKEGTDGKICGWHKLKQCTAHCGPGKDVLEANADKCGTHTKCFTKGYLFTSAQECSESSHYCRPSGAIEEWTEQREVGTKENPQLITLLFCKYANTCKVGVKYPCCKSPHHPDDKTKPKTCRDDRFGIVTKPCTLFTSSQISDYIETTSTELPWATSALVYARANYARFAEDKYDMGCLIKAYIKDKVEYDVLEKIKKAYRRKYQEKYDPSAFDCENFKVKPVPEECSDPDSRECFHIEEYNDNLEWFRVHKDFIPTLRKNLEPISTRDQRKANHAKPLEEIKKQVNSSLRVATQSLKEGGE